MSATTAQIPMDLKICLNFSALSVGLMMTLSHPIKVSATT